MINFEGLIKDVEDYEKALGSKELAVQLLSAVLIAESIRDFPEKMAHELALMEK